MLCSNLSLQQSNALYDEVLRAADVTALQRLCREDLFFLLTRGVKRMDANHPWIYQRCREVEADPDGYLDLWAREHYKSTIITFAKTTQDILINPEVTVGIFSHTRPIAKGFMSQIKYELESNTFLQDLFPDVLYREPKRESPCWSMDNGITVRRTTNPKEATVEAWGLVDGQPTSKHFTLLVYDDAVTVESVSTPDQIKKVVDSMALSYNLGARGGARRWIGTRYRENDPYQTVIDRGTAKVREHGPTDLGKTDFKIEGNPVLLTTQSLKKKREDMGPYIYACQMLQNPMADRVMGFKSEWLCFYDQLRNTSGWNFYLLCDSANEKKKENDYTVMLVIALAPDRNYYLVDGVRDRLNLTERTSKYMALHRKWKPLRAGYEKYGIQSDIEHIRYIQEVENYRFDITPLGGPASKNDRIRRLVPIFEQRRFWLPNSLYFMDYEKRVHDLVDEIVKQEYIPFPVAVHDDTLDTAARILDPDLQARFPMLQDTRTPSITMEHDTDKVQTEYKLFK